MKKLYALLIKRSESYWSVWKTFYRLYCLIQIFKIVIIQWQFIWIQKIFIMFQEEEGIMQIRLTRIVIKISFTYLIKFYYIKHWRYLIPRMCPFNYYLPSATSLQLRLMIFECIIITCAYLCLWACAHVQRSNHQIFVM